MEQTGKRDSAIELVRVVAMFMIIFDHMLLPINLPCKSIISQFLNSGVYIFIILSGYLAGKKVITDWKSWYIKKIKRIMIPYWIVILICLTYESIYTHTFNVKMWLVHILDLQGIFGASVTTNPLWFVTLIMLLYLITPVYQWIGCNYRRWVKVLLPLIVVFQIVFAYTTDIGLQYGHNLSWCMAALISYGIGYFLSDVNLQNITLKKTVGITVIAIAVMVLAMLVRNLYDNTPIYDKVVSYDAMVFMSLDIALIVYFIGKYIKGEKSLKVIRLLDRISYEFYLIHQFIIVTIGYSIVKRYSMFVYLIVTIILTLILSCIVNKIKGLIEEKI